MTTIPLLDPLLSVRGLTKSFTLHAVDGRTVEALLGVDFDVFPQEHVCLAGSSGAGKSSVLKAIHRTYVADGGTMHYRSDPSGALAGREVDLATIDERSIIDLRAEEIGYVSQFLRAEPRRGVLDVVTRAALPASSDRSVSDRYPSSARTASARSRTTEELTEAEQRAAEVLRRLHIDERLWQTYPTLLSGGEKQRVNLAAGIVARPRLLLLDEPVSALDPANRAAVIDVIADLTAQGTTVLSVFHDLPAIHQLADRVVLMADGVVVDTGSPDRLLDHVMATA